MASDDEIQRLESEPPPADENTDAKTRVGELPEGFLKTLRQGGDPLPDIPGLAGLGAGVRTPVPPSLGKPTPSWSKAPAAGLVTPPGDAPATVPPPADGARDRVPSLGDAAEEGELTMMHSSALTADSEPPGPVASSPGGFAPGSLAPSEGFPVARSAPPGPPRVAYSAPPGPSPSAAPPVAPLGLPGPAPAAGGLLAAASLPPASFGSVAPPAGRRSNLTLGLVALLVLGGGLLAVVAAFLAD